MILLKKLIFAPMFLIVFTALIYQLAPLLKSYDLVFSLSLNMTIKLIGIAALVAASSFLFALFIFLSSNWKISLPVGIVAATVPFVFIPSSLALIFAAGIFISLLLTNLSLDTTLKTYINFQPSALLGPSIRHLSTLLILSFCLIYFLSVSKAVAKNGFQIPDSLIDTALKMTPVSTPLEQPEELELLKKNPANDLIKKTVKDQIQNFIKPYTSFIPTLLAVLLFLTFQSLVSLLNLFIYPLLWFLFSILEKIGFVKFELEQRPVKKLVL